MAYNPMRLALNSAGQMVDKYGRVHEFSEKDLRVARKRLRRWPSYHSHKPRKEAAP